VGKTLNGLIDLQCFVSASAKRGIGRYSFELISALQEIPDINWIGFLPASTYQNYESSSVSSIFPRSKLVLFKTSQNPHLTNQQQSSINQFNVFNAMKNIDFDFLFQLSPLAEPPRNWINPELLYNSKPVFSMFYDAIKPSKKNSDYDFSIETYQERVRSLDQIDYFFCLSEQSEKELQELLPKSKPSRIIGGGATISNPQKNYESKDKLGRTIFLFPGAGDERKGLDTLIHAVQKLDESSQKRIHIKATSTNTEFGRKMQKQIAQFEIEHCFEFLPDVDEDCLLELHLDCDALIFPSNNEGLGLPVLDARTVGKPIITTRISSILPICTNPELLIDPMDDRQLSELLHKYLNNAEFKTKSEQIATNSRINKKEMWMPIARQMNETIITNYQTFSKTKSEKLYDDRELCVVEPSKTSRSGIAYVNKPLNHELGKYFTVFDSTDGQTILRALVSNNVITVLGNSPDNLDALFLLAYTNAVLDLHDLTLDRLFDDLLKNYESSQIAEFILFQFGLKLFLKLREQNNLGEDLGLEITKSLVSRNDRIIVHSKLSANFFPHASLIQIWDKWDVDDRISGKFLFNNSEEILNFKSFGYIGKSKCLLEILEILNLSDFKSRIHFTVVGSGDPLIIQELLNRSKIMGLSLEITGFVDDESYVKHLKTADLALQFREAKRAEFPSTILDCLHFGLPTLINFDTSSLDIEDGYFVNITGNSFLESAKKMDSFLVDDARKMTMYDFIDNNFANSFGVAVAARKYREALSPSLVSEPRMLPAFKVNVFDIFSEIAKVNGLNILFNELAEVRYENRVFVLLTDEVTKSSIDGILRVSKNLLLSLSQNLSVPVIPLIRVGANLEVPENLGLIDPNFSDFFDDFPIVNKEVSLNASDLLLIPGMDASIQLISEKLVKATSLGTRIISVIHDILPITHPDLFRDDFVPIFKDWISETLIFSTELVFDSETTLRSCFAYLDMSEKHKANSYKIEPSFASKDSILPIVGMQQQNSFLLLGTIEPRKGHLEVLEAFKRIWDSGKKTKLMIAGKIGWKCDDLLYLIHRLELDYPLYFHESPSEEELNEILNDADTVILSSLVEGFCLPGLEAIEMGMNVIARDIPIYREILGDVPSYFQDTASLENLILNEFIVLDENQIQDRSTILNRFNEQSTVNKWNSLLFPNGRR
jgi:glycosyltransferase involved in cell wall biosynthesis